MATTRQFILHDNLIGGVETTLPAHLLKPDQWRTQHNFRLTPALTQVPKKVIHSELTSAEDVRWLGHIPDSVPGRGKTIVLTPTNTRLLNDTALNAVAHVNDGVFRRWATVLYNGSLYYTNDLNPIRVCNGSTDTGLVAAPAGRYLCSWYDHLVTANVTYQGTYYPSRVMCSHLYDFQQWTPTATNEADHYDMVEWEQTDHPYSGCTGVAKLVGLLWVFTPTAIIPMQYVGLPKVLRVADEGIVTKIGNTLPWTLVTLDKIAFFYDGIEKSFFAFDGQQIIPVGEPIRQWFVDNLSTNPALANKTYGYLDVDNREIWWNFVSRASAGPFDKAVVFNYRYRRWFTASVENVLSFCGSVYKQGTIAELVGAISGLTGVVGDLGAVTGITPRLFGSAAGELFREAVVGDDNEILLSTENPVLESGDFHYGDIRTVKENDGIIINAAMESAGEVEVKVKARDFLSTTFDWSDETKVGDWKPTLQDGMLNYNSKSGRVLRYRFEFTDCRTAKFDAFSDAVYAHKADK